MHLEITINDGEVEVDVIDGDGTTCQNLAQPFFDLFSVEEVEEKPELHSGVRVGTRTTT